MLLLSPLWLFALPILAGNYTLYQRFLPAPSSSSISSPSSSSSSTPDIAFEPIGTIVLEPTFSSASYEPLPSASGSETAVGADGETRKGGWYQLCVKGDESLITSIQTVSHSFPPPCSLVRFISATLIYSLVCSGDARQAALLSCLLSSTKPSRNQA